MKCSRIVISRISAFVLTAGCLIACSPAETVKSGSEPSAEAVSTDSKASDLSASVNAVTVGGDGSAIRMEPLTESDIQSANLGGELACSFTQANAAPLLLATGIVASDEPAFGVVKIAGYVERIAAPGGFEGITTNTTFTGQGKTIRIDLTGPAVGGGESPHRPATLTYMRADGAELTLEGRWNCGP